MTIMPSFCVQTVTVCLLSVLVLQTTAAQTPVEPLLQKYCLGCHNENDREAGLSLQTPESLTKGSENGPVLDKSDLSKSLLLMVLDKASKKSMPPDGEPQPTDAERELLKNWVLAGGRIKSMAAGIPDVPTVKPFRGVTAALLASAVLPDGKTVVVAGGRHVAAREIESGKELWKTPLEAGKVTGLVVAKQKPWIVAATGTPGVAGAAVVLSTADGGVVTTFGGHTDALYAAVLNQADTLLATAGYDRRILIHDVQTQQVLQTLDGHNGSVFCLAFDPSGQILCSASADGTVKVWNVTTGKRLDTLSQPQAEQYSVLVSNNGHRIYAAGADNRIRIWNLVSRDKATINPLLVSRFAHEQPISRLAMSADGTLLASCAEDRTLRTWTMNPLEVLETLPRQQVAITSLAFVDNQRLFVTRLDGSTGVLPLQASPGVPGTVAPHSTKNLLAANLPETITEVNEAPKVNDDAAGSQLVTLPAKISGVINPAGGNDRDVDCYRFAATAGQTLLLEVRAQQDKSPLDSKIEILTTAGQPVLQTRLQAVRDSYFTFRGKDSTTSDDFRVFNWQEMDLNQYLYADGEVVRLWLYPRGPDSGYKVYPGFGNRFTYFGTTATSHALQAPCFIVVPRGVDEEITANGLPVFSVNYENDDDGRRELGTDSRLFFTAPADGEYVVRLSDARGFSGPDFKYQLTVRPPKPAFNVSQSTRKISVAAGTGSEITFMATRIDGYEGPITIDVENLPAGFGFSGPIQIQEQQMKALGTLFATADAKPPTAEEVANIGFVAHAPPESVVGESSRKLERLEELKLLDVTKLRVSITTVADAADAPEPTVAAAAPLVLQIHPGETIRAMVRLDRVNHTGVVSLGKEDAGRNMPHGVFVDNIGLNGLLLLSDQSEREFFITAAKWVPPSTTTFFLKSNVDAVTSLPVTLEVLPGNDNAPAATITAVAE